jgi:hypothetical protein
MTDTLTSQNVDLFSWGTCMYTMLRRNDEKGIESAAGKTGQDIIK